MPDMNTLRAGDTVEVRSEQEILRTLDEDGKLDGLPFMPEMLGFCGQRYRVRARAHKACDTIDWQQYRRMENAVHLEELRCDGSAHGGFQAGCLLFWKEAWLRPVDPALNRLCTVGTAFEPRSRAEVPLERHASSALISRTGPMTFGPGLELDRG